MKYLVLAYGDRRIGTRSPRTSRTRCLRRTRFCGNGEILWRQYKRR
jgi:hypothetical protein